MSKEYKISYKTYFNERLKQVFFHGKMTYPLYVQVTYDRKSIVFKSYYFELFSKPRYVIFMGGDMFGPSIEQIIEKENELIEFVINKMLDDFSLERFKKEYAYYATDLCDVTEQGFIDYMFVFFQDEGMSALATVVQQGSKFPRVYEVVRDMKRAFNKPLYEKLVENSFYFAPPYLPLYGFMQQTKKWPMLSLAIMEWDNEKTQADFQEYCKRNYPNIAPPQIVKQIENLISEIRKSLY